MFCLLGFQKRTLKLMLRILDAVEKNGSSPAVAEETIIEKITDDNEFQRLENSLNEVEKFSSFVSFSYISYTYIVYRLKKFFRSY